MAKDKLSKKFQWEEGTIKLELPSLTKKESLQTFLEKLFKKLK